MQESHSPLVVDAAVELALPREAGVHQVQRAGGALEAALVEGVLHHAHDVAITNWLAAVGALAGRLRCSHGHGSSPHTGSHSHGSSHCHSVAGTHSLRSVRSRCRRCWRCKAVHSIEAALPQGDALAGGQWGHGWQDWMGGSWSWHLLLLVYGMVAVAGNVAAVVVAATSVDVSAD